jgi:hypothetical protein
MLNPKDREYAGELTAILVASCLIKGLAITPELITTTAANATLIVHAVDRHIAPKKRPKGRERDKTRRY